MTSEGSLTLQVDSFNIKKEMWVLDINIKSLLFCFCFEFFFDVWFQLARVDLRLCSQG